MATREEMKAALRAAGWTVARIAGWRSPKGKFYRSLEQAYQVMIKDATSE